MVTTQPTDEKWFLPPKHRLDSAEKLAAADLEQIELSRRTQSPFAQLSAEERERAAAVRLVAEHKATVELLRGMIKAHEARPGDEPKLLRHRRELKAAREALPLVLSQLAEAYATTGYFETAAHYEPDRAKKAFYLRVWRAMWREDGHWCECPNTPTGLPHTFVVNDIYSIRHQRMMPLMKCKRCKCLNVAPLRPELVAQRAHRRTAHGMAAGKSPEEAKALLASHKHTTKDLLQK
ncbi:MAG TPA: hypothetical protein VEZ40_17150 [Pyrinomonadaceae bacterium]|nr:hypothetical protein [Pyrinomonadaceae bacterium]